MGDRTTNGGAYELKYMFVERCKGGTGTFACGRGAWRKPHDT